MIMVFSIPEIGKKINSKLSFYDCLAFCLLAAFGAGLAVFLHYKALEKRLPVLYKESRAQVLDATTHALPFGSKKGKTYTYSWCKGSSPIKQANKIYFTSDAEAIASGRTLSKLCVK